MFKKSYFFIVLFFLCSLNFLDAISQQDRDAFTVLLENGTIPELEKKQKLNATKRLELEKKIRLKDFTAVPEREEYIEQDKKLTRRIIELELFGPSGRGTKMSAEKEQEHKQLTQDELDKQALIHQQELDTQKQKLLDEKNRLEQTLQQQIKSLQDAHNLELANKMKGITDITAKHAFELEEKKKLQQAIKNLTASYDTNSKAKDQELKKLEDEKKKQKDWLDLKLEASLIKAQKEQKLLVDEKNKLNIEYKKALKDLEDEANKHKGTAENKQKLQEEKDSLDIEYKKALKDLEEAQNLAIQLELEKNQLLDEKNTLKNELEGKIKDLKESHEIDLKNKELGITDIKEKQKLESEANEKLKQAITDLTNKYNDETKTKDEALKDLADAKKKLEKLEEGKQKLQDALKNQTLKHQEKLKLEEAKFEEETMKLKNELTQKIKDLEEAKTNKEKAKTLEDEKKKLQDALKNQTQKHQEKLKLEEAKFEEETNTLKKDLNQKIKDLEEAKTNKEKAKTLEDEKKKLQDALKQQTLKHQEKLKLEEEKNKLLKEELDKQALKHEEELKKAKEKGNTPLHSAIESGSFDEIRKLIVDDNVDVNAQNADGNTPLIMAAKLYGDVKGHKRGKIDLDVVKKILNFLVKTGKAQKTITNNFGKNALYYVNMANADTETIELLNPGVKVKEQKKKGLFDDALSSGNISTNDLENKDENGSNILHAIIDRFYTFNKDNGSYQIADVTLENQKKLTDLFKKALIDQPELIEQKNKNGDTPLHTLIGRDYLFYGKNDIASTMLAALFDLITNNTLKSNPLNIPNKNGETPLHLAIETQPSGIIDDLIKHGALVTATDNNGATPLHKLAEMNPTNDSQTKDEYKATINLFTSHDSDAKNRKENKGKTPYDLANEAYEREKNNKELNKRIPKWLHEMLKP